MKSTAAQEFLKRHDMSPESVVPSRDAEKMAEDMKRGLNGQKSSLPMIPTYLSAEGTILLHEPVSNIKEKYLESSIYVMSSRFEAFPLVLLEAMACGVPCVSFDCPNGPRNIIRHGEDGLLVDYLNPKALADGICRLIADEPLRRRLGENARRNVQRFSRDAIMQQWEDLFNKLTKELHT